MKKYDIIKQMAENKSVEKLVDYFWKIRDKEDLSQYIYLWLLQMDDDRFMEIYNEGRINYYLVGLIRNQTISSTSYYIRMNSSCGLSKANSVSEYNDARGCIEEIKKPHQFEDEVDAAINSLTEIEREIILINVYPLQDRKPHIDELCEKYGISYLKYQHLFPIIKMKLAKKLGIKIIGKENKRKIYQYDKQMNLINVWDDTVEAAYELGCNTDGIYKVCQGVRKTYKGFIWKFEKN